MQDSLEQHTFADATQAAAAVAVQSRADHGAREPVLGGTPAILAFNRQTVQAQPANETAILAEQAAHEQRAVEERDDIRMLREYRGDDLPDETSVAGLAMMIQADPIRASMWLLNLAAEVRVQRMHLEALTIRLSATVTP